MATIAPSGEDAITRMVEIDPYSVDSRIARAARDSNDFEDFWEIERTAVTIKSNGFRQVALQFPDELLKDSVSIFRTLKRRLKATHCQLYLLADTSYGSCCVDEVAASHVAADAIVHYGHACLSATSRLPVIYVFGKHPLSIDGSVGALVQSSKTSGAALDSILLRHEPCFSHLGVSLVERLSTTFPTSKLIYVPSRSYQDPTSSIDPPKKPDITNITTVVYIGGESLALTNLTLAYAHAQIHVYDPISRTASLHTSRSNSLLGRRYALVQKARDSDVFGILVGTLGVAQYLPLMASLRRLLARYQKKSYTVTVGKLNPAKLANFAEIECWVLVACPENSLIQSKEYHRPIITPYEVLTALDSERSWDGSYQLDFGRLIAENDSSTGKVRDEESEDQPTFSLVTGKYRHAKKYGSAASDASTSGTNGSLVLRNTENALARRMDDSAASNFLANRTFRGLDPKLGQDAPGVLEEGRRGIARQYDDDHETS